MTYTYNARTNVVMSLGKLWSRVSPAAQTNGRASVCRTHRPAVSGQGGWRRGEVEIFPRRRLSPAGGKEIRTCAMPLILFESMTKIS